VKRWLRPADLGSSSSRIAAPLPSVQVSVGSRPTIFLVGESNLERYDLAAWVEGGAVVIIAPSVEVIHSELVAEEAPVAPAATRPESFAVGDFHVDLLEKRASWRGTPLSVSQRELLFLAVLAERPGRACSFEELALRVWGVPLLGDLSAIRSTVKRLRLKLRQSEVALNLASVRGVGFRIESVDGAYSSIPATG
jgi:hypothetical protein